MPVKNMPPVWRDSVQVVLRIRTSISPEARIVGRSLALIGRNLTFVGSLKIAARIGAADQLAPRLDLIERTRVGGHSGRGERRAGNPGNKRSHVNLLFDAKLEPSSLSARPIEVNRLPWATEPC